MRKKQIIDWLECMRCEKIEECAKKTQEEKSRLEKEILYQNKTDDVAHEIYKRVREISKLIDDWKNGFDDRIEKGCYYESIERFITKFSSEKDVYDRLKERDCYIPVAGDIEKLINLHNETEEKIKMSYGSVIANVRALPTAKKGLEYLKEIGFDTSELEERCSKKDVSTALSTPIDTKYLFIGGGKND